MHDQLFDSLSDTTAASITILILLLRCNNRYLISDSCVLARKPLIYGAAMGFEGQVMMTMT